MISHDMAVCGRVGQVRCMIAWLVSSLTHQHVVSELRNQEAGRATAFPFNGVWRKQMRSSFNPLLSLITSCRSLAEVLLYIHQLYHRSFVVLLAVIGSYTPSPTTRINDQYGIPLPLAVPQRNLTSITTTQTYRPQQLNPIHRPLDRLESD